MFGLNPYSLAAKAGVILLALLVGAWGGHKVTSNAWKAAQAEELKAAIKARSETEDRYNALSRDYELAQAKRRIVTRTVYKEADAWVAGHPAAQCLDPSGVMLVNRALGVAPADPR